MGALKLGPKRLTARGARERAMKCPTPVRTRHCASQTNCPLTNDSLATLTFHRSRGRVHKTEHCELHCAARDPRPVIMPRNASALQGAEMSGNPTSPSGVSGLGN